MTARVTGGVEVQISCIADHLDLVPTIARWHYEEWGRLDPLGTLETWTQGLLERTNRDRIPTSLVAFHESTAVGSVTLVEHDMATRPDLTPCLAGLFVLPEHRRHGVGSALVRRANHVARGFGVSTLYLYTRGSERLYESLGWRSFGREFYEGRWVTLMVVDLADAP